MKISLAGWSLNRRFHKTKANPNPTPFTEFPRIARGEFGINAIELNSPFMESTLEYARRYKQIAGDHSVELLNIAVDEAADLSDLNGETRKAAVGRYARWIPIAAELGCTAIRANSGGRDRLVTEALITACAESFTELTRIGQGFGVKVCLENHWGLSENPDAILAVVRKVNSPWMGTLPDFGNWPDTIDRYEATAKIMPYAVAVHAKMYDFEPDGEQARYSVGRMVEIVKASRYEGYLAIEYEGRADDHDGILKSKKLLLRYI